MPVSVSRPNVSNYFPDQTHDPFPPQKNETHQIDEKSVNWSEIEEIPPDQDSSSKGDIMRRYQTLIDKFEEVFWRLSDVKMDDKEPLVKALAKAYEGRQDALEKQAWGPLLLQGLGAGAGLITGVISMESVFKELTRIISVIAPELGKFVSAHAQASSVGYEKDQQLINTELSKLEAVFNTIARILNNYYSSKQRIQDEMSFARQQG